MTSQQKENAQPMMSQSPAPPEPPSMTTAPFFDTFSSATPVQSPVPNPLPSARTMKMAKKQRHIKGEYRRKLKDENLMLKKQIKELELEIFTKEAENAALQNQLRFFQQHMSDSAENDENSGHPETSDTEEKESPEK